MRSLRLAVAALVLLAAAAPAAADAPARAIRCGTLERLPALEGRARPAPVAHAGPNKLVRDGFGGVYTVRESANFAVKWQSASLTEEQAQTVLDTLEATWVKYASLGHAGPTGTETYKLNAYVHGIEDNPPIDFDGGYASLDDQGYPYFVISSNIIDDGDEVVQHVTAHELYHDYQLSLSAFADQSGYWFWEATADWAAQETFPALARPYAFVGAYALATELALFSAGDPFGEDPIAGVHQYGSSIFERYLTDRLDDPTLVPRAWMESGPGDDPLEVMDGLLPAGAIEGGLAGAFADFAATNAIWDYPQRAQILGWVEAYAQQFPGRPRYHATIFGEGTGGFDEIEPARALRSFGYHVLRFVWPADGVVELSLELDAAGSSGTPAGWAAVVVYEVEGGEPVYLELPIDGGAATLELPRPEGGELGYLAISVTGDARDEAETFGYRYRIGPPAEPAGPDAGPGEEPEEPPGCCSMGGGGGAPGSALLALVVVMRLGRRRARPRVSDSRART